MKTKNKLLHLFIIWLPTIFWALIIFSFSARPSGVVSEIDWQDFIFKKTIHMIEYGIFTMLLFRSFKGSGIEKGKALYFSFFTAVLYGLSDEFHQSFTPGRTPKLRDVGFDSLGSLLSLLTLVKLMPKVPEKYRKVFKYFGFEYK